MAEQQVIRGACPHDCPDTCAWQVTVEDGRAIKLVGDPDHPFTHGGLCAKVNHYLDRVYGPERLTHPLRRTGPKGSGAFERVSWDEALDGIAARLREIVAEHGGEAVMPYSYMGTQGLLQASSMDRRFFSRLGSTDLLRTMCGNTGSAGAGRTNGSHLGILPRDIRQARFIVLWGTNTVVTNLHLWRFIREAREAGARIVVIDPLKTRTAESADWHVRPRPGTDTALALGLMHVILREGLQDVGYIERHTTGFEELEQRAREFPPERASAITGVPAAEIEELARAYATTRPALIRLLIGMEHRENGGAAFQAIAALPALTGAWREAGGGLLFLTAALFFASLNQEGLELPGLAPGRRRIVNMVHLGRALTRTDLRPPVKALIVYASNPAAVAPDQNRVLEGLRREDLLTVVHEQVMTDTAAHADYVLPATTQVEHLDLLWSWGHEFLTLNLPAVEPQGEAVPTTELFRRLAARIGFAEPCFADSDERLLEIALESDHPFLEGISLERLRRDGWARLNLPDPWLPYADGGFATASGKADLAPDGLAVDYVPGGESPAGDPGLAARYPLVLISSKSALHFLNSSYGGLQRHVRLEGEPRLDLSAYDAAARGIEDGEMVRTFNDRGSVFARARVGDRVPPGTVAMPSGWWASLSPGGSSVNALTQDAISDYGEGPAFHDALVEVMRGEPATR